ncbi:glycosyltransferase family 2 protein [Chamaesiphon sp.]|uniref:glycosyltransferase family 2 protein n=1 Tax=Chamaesiphon sp. TaxID=2814140 RepID=UPI003593A8FE
MKTPVVFIIFNRKETTHRVFEAIRQAQPTQLFVIADGPRSDKIGEAEKCMATRAIIDRVDWDCEVKTNYSDINLGCKLRPSTGIDWVFKQVEEAIILEDDCLPDPTFFAFCDEMLEKYRHDTRIMAIGGNNFQFGRQRTNDSYYFSRFPHCWGWATWRRAWAHFDIDIKLWPTVRDGDWLRDILTEDAQVKTWEQTFQSVYEHKIDTAWDYQWTFACWINSGLAILPNTNLVTNIGFGADATHTTGGVNKLANMPVKGLTQPLQHPRFVVRDAAADRYTYQNIFDVTLLTRLKKAIVRYGLGRSNVS